jgi:AcrR family transcriptional regulator
MSVTADHEPGLRERKKLQTRQRLREVALRLATERGVEHVTVEDIAATAEVSTRTFFNYFASKEEALVGPDPDAAYDLARALSQRPSDESPLESLRQLMQLRAANIEERIDDVRARMHLVTHCAALQPGYLATAAAFDRILTEGIAARLGTDPDVDLYPALIAAVASTAMRTTIVTWLNTPNRRPLTQMIDEAFAQLAAGLPPPAGASRPASPSPGRTPRPSARARTSR